MRKIVLMVFLSLFLCGKVYCDGIYGVGWTPPPDTNIASYNIYSSDVSGQCDIAIGTEIASTPAGVHSSVITLLTGQRYVVVTAINNNGEQSICSNELSYQVPVGAPRDFRKIPIEDVQ